MTTKTETADIVERLREGKPAGAKWTMLAGAREIERLQGKFKEIIDLFEYHVKTYDHVSSNLYLMAKIARDALTERECTCHPSEAPTPCQKKYAFNECHAAALKENE